MMSGAILSAARFLWPRLSMIDMVITFATFLKQLLQLVKEKSKANQIYKNLFKTRSAAPDTIQTVGGKMKLPVGEGVHVPPFLQ